MPSLLPPKKIELASLTFFRLASCCEAVLEGMGSVWDKAADDCPPAPSLCGVGKVGCHCLGGPPQAYMPEAKSFCIWAWREKFGNDWQKHFSHTDERQRQTFWEGGSKVVSKLLSGRSPLPSTLYSE